jgi:hypothetical protein
VASHDEFVESPEEILSEFNSCIDDEIAINELNEVDTSFFDFDEALLSRETADVSNTSSFLAPAVDQIEEFHSHLLTPDATQTIDDYSLNHSPHPEYEHQNKKNFLIQSSSPQEGKYIPMTNEQQVHDIHVIADPSGLIDIPIELIESTNPKHKYIVSNGRESGFPNSETHSNILKERPVFELNTMDHGLARTPNLYILSVLDDHKNSNSHKKDGDDINNNKTDRKRKRKATDENEALLPVLEKTNKKLRLKEESLRKKVETLKAAYIRAITTGKLVFTG